MATRASDDSDLVELRNLQTEYLPQLQECLQDSGTSPAWCLRGLRICRLLEEQAKECGVPRGTVGSHAELNEPFRTAWELHRRCEAEAMRWVAKRNDTIGGNALLYRMMKQEWKRDIDELANQFDQDSRARGEPSALEKLSKMQAEIKAGQLEVKNLSSSQEDLLRIALEAQALPMPSPVEPLNNPDAGLNRAAEAIPEAEEREEKQPDQHPGDEVESSSKVADLLASLPKSKEEAPDMDLEHLSVEQKDLLIAAFEAQARPMPTVATKSSPAMGNSSGTAPAASVEDVEDEDRLGGA